MTGEKIKTLSNCTDVEFLRQTNRIRKEVKKWLDVTKIPEIRKRLPALEKVPEGASQEERERIAAANKKAAEAQGLANVDAILDEALEKHPEETVRVIKLCCFLDPDKEPPKRITYYMAAFAEMLKDKDVLDFFSSLRNLGTMLGLSI